MTAQNIEQRERRNTQRQEAYERRKKLKQHNSLWAELERVAQGEVKRPERLPATATASPSNQAKNKQKNRQRMLARQRQAAERQAAEKQKELDFINRLAQQCGGRDRLRLMVASNLLRQRRG